MRSYNSRKTNFTPLNLFYRAIGSGTIIASAVVLSQLVGPTFGGIFSVFPVVFISNIVIAYYTRGVEFARSLTKPLMLSGMINVPIYAVAVRYLYPWAGLAWGTCLAFLVAIVSTYCTFLFATSYKSKLVPLPREVES